jgi:hypothetical protein
MHLMCCLHRVPGEAMMSLMSGVLGTHGHARGPRATGHVTAPKPSRTGRRVWSHMTRGGTKALSGGGPGALVTWRCQSLPAQGAGLEPRGTWQLRSPLLPGDRLGARGNTGSLSWQVARTVPQDTWRHWGPFLAGGSLSAMGHVAIPEPSSGG